MFAFKFRFRFKWQLLFLSILVLTTGSIERIESQEQKKKIAQTRTADGQPDAQVRLEEKEIVSKPVKFFNQTRKRAQPQLAQENYRLGALLAKKRKNAPNQRTISASGIRLHRILPETQNQSTLLGADVMTIAPNVTITHINVLRRILTGYIQEMFSYSMAHSRFLANYALYYNALRYGNAKYVKQRYLPQVVAHLGEMPPGIPLQYKNWPGRTALLLPLWRSSVYSGSSDLVRNEINETVKENKKLRREGIVDDDAFAKLDQRRQQEHEKKLRDKNADINTSLEELEKKQEKSDKEKNNLQQKKDATEESLERQKLQNEIDTIKKQEQENSKTAQELETEQQAVVQEAQKVAGLTQANANSSGQKNPQQQPIQSTDPKQTGGIIGPQKRNEAPPVLPDGKQLLMEVYRPTEKGHYQNKLSYFEPAKEKKGKKSDFLNICSRTYFIIEDVGVLVTGYAGEHDDPENQKLHNLILLRPTHPE